MNNSSDGSPNDYCSSKYCNQGVRPKVKSTCSNESELCTNIQNGSGSHSEELNNTQNGASSSCLVCLSASSSSVGSSPSTSCFNQIPHDKQNGEYSGEKSSSKGRSLSSEENDTRNHDKKRKTGCFVDSESSSGNENEEGFSGDDCCIYTYKGDQFADLPNSFFPSDMVVNGGHQALRENHRKANNRREPDDRSNLGSSPEMDYLEMDFDPGPSLEQDSEEDLNSFERKPNDSPVQGYPNDVFLNYRNDDEVPVETVKADLFQENNEFESELSNKNGLQCALKRQSEVSDCNSNSFNRTKEFLSNCCAGFCTVDKNGQNYCESDQGVKEGKLENGVNNVNSKSCPIMLGERLMSNILSTEENDSSASANNKRELDSKTSFDGIMFWSEQEAVSKQVILVSSDVSCAATAAINAMLVLKVRISVERVKQGISSKSKSESAPIPQYLLSRSHSGVSHENLIRGIHHASHGLLYARFFQMYPRRDISLTRWLVHWMKKGAVPIATMNVQRDSPPEDPTLDVRHHQMIFGVNSKGIYLTNPLECLQEEELWSRLVSPCVLKIKRSEIISRWTPDSNLKPLMFQTDVRWKEMNVLGQVVNIIRESSGAGTEEKFLTQHILIPASSGITLVIPRHSPGYEELVVTADLPILSDSKPK